MLHIVAILHIIVVLGISTPLIRLCAILPFDYFFEVLSRPRRVWEPSRIVGIPLILLQIFLLSVVILAQKSTAWIIIVVCFVAHTQDVVTQIFHLWLLGIVWLRSDAAAWLLPLSLEHILCLLLFLFSGYHSIEYGAFGQILALWSALSAA